MQQLILVRGLMCLWSGEAGLDNQVEQCLIDLSTAMMSGQLPPRLADRGNLTEGGPKDRCRNEGKLAATQQLSETKAGAMTL